MALAHPHPPHLKKPAIFGWEVFSKRPPTEAEFAKWMKIYWNYGVGLAFGLDNVIGVDLDWLDPAIAAQAWDITIDILGETPLVRVGRAPKRLALYRIEPGFVIRRKYDGFELFTRSGQCVVAGIHPDTGQPYRWEGETPATLGPAELPLVIHKQVHALVDALEDLDPEAKAVAAPRVREDRHHRRDPARAPNVADPQAEAAKILAATPHGKRHDTMVGAVMALAMRGYSDYAIFVALDGDYSDIMSDELGWEAPPGARERHPLGPRARRSR